MSSPADARTHSQLTSAINKKTGFRPGRSAAREARLFLFTGEKPGEGEPLVKQVTVCNLREAMTYRQNRHADFDIMRVEFVA